MSNALWCSARSSRRPPRHKSTLNPRHTPLPGVRARKKGGRPPAVSAAMSCDVWPAYIMSRMQYRPFTFPLVRAGLNP
eukprot:2057342-Pyramimonas_sp.AAC.1